MKKIKKLVIAILAVLSIGVFTSEVKAQDYDFAAGINVGANVGINAKYFLSESGAIEAAFAYGFRYNSPMFSAVYQYHIPLLEGFKLYAGAGVNVGAIGSGKFHKTEFAFGVDPNVGFEYKFANAPVALAIDYKPAINFTCHSQWEEAVIKIRYTF